MEDTPYTGTDLSEVGKAIASEFPGGVAPGQPMPDPSTSPDASYTSVGDVAYQKTVDPQTGQAAWNGPDGTKLSDAELNQKRLDYEKFGGAAGTTAATLAGAGRGVTFGLSDLALVKSGLVDKETLQKLKEINPAASFTGEAGAIAATLIPSGGSSLLEGAGLATRAVSRAGKIAEGLTAAGLESAKATTIAQKILQSAVSVGAGSAVEGSFYGAGQVISDYALGDPDLNGEKVLSTIGLSALTGGVLGGSLGGLSEVGPSILEKGREALQKVGDSMNALSEGTSDLIAKAASKISNQPYEDIRPFVGFNKESQELRAQGLAPKGTIEENKKVFVNSLQDVYDTGQKVSRELNTIRKVEIDSLLAENPVDHGAAINEAEAFATRMKAQLNEMRQNPEVYSDKARIKKFEDQFEILQKQLPEVKTASDAFHLINETKQELDPILDWNRVTEPGAKDTVDQLSKIRRDAKNYLTDPEIFGHAAAAQADMNDVLSEVATAEKRFQKKFATLEPQKGGRPQYQLDPQKFSRYLTDPLAAKAMGRDEVIQNYLASQSKLHDLVDRMAKGPYQVADLIDNSPVLGSARSVSEKASSQAQKELAGFKAQAKIKHIGHSNLLSTGEAIGTVAAYHVAGPVGLGAAAVVNMLKHPANLVKGMFMVERTIGSVTKSVEGALDAFLKKSGSTNLRRAIVPVSVNALDQTSFGISNKKSREASDKSTQSAYNQRLSELAQMVSDPEKTATDLQKHLAPLNRVAPNISQAMNLKALSMLHYLHETAPKDPLAGQGLNLTPRDYKPSDVELAKWQRRVAVVENPLSVLDDLRAGRLNKESIEALQVNYPKLFEEMQTTLMGKLAEDRPNLSYSQKLQLSHMFQMPVDPAFQSKFIANMQQIHADAGASKPPNPTPTNISKMKLSDSQQTETERVLNR